jgi:multiple antibiotic resistance protein
MAQELAKYMMLCFGSLFSIVDPFAAVPIFLGLVGSHSKAGQARIARQASLTCFAVLTSFALAGALIFNFFGITIPAFKLAGGILLFGVAVEMMNAKHSSTRTTSEEQHEAETRAEVGLIPLGLPLLSGPGAIATVMVLSGKAKDIEQRIGLHLAILAVSIITFMTLRSATVVARVFGKTGLNVIGRLMGLILAAVAMQFVIDGVRDALPGLAREIHG